MEGFVGLLRSHEKLKGYPDGQVLRKAYEGPSSTLGSVTAWTVGLNSKPRSIADIQGLLLMFYFYHLVQAAGAMSAALSFIVPYPSQLSIIYMVSLLIIPSFLPPSFSNSRVPARWRVEWSLCPRWSTAVFMHQVM